MRESERDALGKFRLEPVINGFVAPATRFFPDLRILKRRHQYLLSTDRVHLLPYDRFYLFEYTKPQRQKRIHARHLFMDESSAQQELRILRYFVFRRLATGFREKLALSHVFRHCNASSHELKRNTRLTDVELVVVFGKRSL